MGIGRRGWRLVWRYSLRLSLPLLVLLLLLLLALLLSAGFYGYHRLTDEALVAELQFRPLAPQRFVATLVDAQGCDAKDYLIEGDQWRIDARFLKWRYWATLVGLDPLYRLERLEGRYQRNAEQNDRPHLAHDLGEAAALDLLAGLERLGRYNLLFDASYGSSAYATIDPNQRYLLYRGQSGLLIRSRPLETSQPGGEGTVITIAHACGDPVSLWRRLAEGLERWLLIRR